MSCTAAGSSGGGGSVVGGGALTRNRNRTWSQSSYDWLRSLRYDRLMSGSDHLGMIYIVSSLSI